MKIREKLRDIFYIRKPWWRFPLAILLLLIILTGSVLAYKALSLTHTVITKGISSTIAGNNLGVTELKGEKDGRVNVVLLGVGVEGQSGVDLTDTIILASFDTKNKAVSMISIPRDLYVKIPEEGYEKINAVYSTGNKGDYECGGGALIKDTISNITGLPIHYYVAIDFDAFKEIVDTLDGVDIQVEKSIYDYEYPSKNERGIEPFIIEKGDYHMDGALALKYVRSRKSTSDFDRARRQQQVIMAIKNKAFEKQIITNPKKVYDLYNTMQKHVKTDLQLPEIGRVVELSKEFNLDNISTTVLDDSADGLLYSDNVNGMYVLKPNNNNYTEIQKYIQFFLNNAQQIKKENAKVEVLNGAGYENLAADIAEQLKKFGINVINVGSADSYSYNETTIYDRTEGKAPGTVSFLVNQLSAQVSNIKKNNESEPDITIIIGKNYDQDQ